jgi:asparagine synthase (glutamine-hydrolysing)
MCGFSGAYAAGSLSMDHINIEKMVAALKHRGPDDINFELKQRCRLGFARLSIIDIAKGRQPFTRGNYTLVFNGEIYNYKLLKQQLLSDGTEFETSSDTEVLFWILVKYGINGLARIAGMFAFAFYDEKEHSLILGRDRFGIKPLYYATSGKFVFFASEISSIFASGLVPRKVSESSISSYLTFRFPINNKCFYENIDILEPATCLVINETIQKKIRYWDYPSINNLVYKSQSQHLEDLGCVLETVMEEHLVSDVDIALLLSGGLDSSLLSALAVRKSAGAVNHAYHIGLTEPGYNEIDDAQLISDHLSLQLRSLELGSNNYLDDLVRCIRHRQVPLSIPHEVPLNQLFREISQSHKVVISGEGADELFGGYGRVQRLGNDYSRIRFLHRLGLPKKLIDYYIKTIKLSGASDVTLAELFLSKYYWWSYAEKRSILSEEYYRAFNDDVGEENFWNNEFGKLSKLNPQDAIIQIFHKHHLPCLLDRLDAHSMAWGVEARVPFVDHRLVELGLSIPSHLKFKWNSSLSRIRSLFVNSFEYSERYDTSKSILRDYASSYIPSTIAHKKKLGFPVPLDIWLRNGGINFFKSVLLDSSTLSSGHYNKKNLELMCNNPSGKSYDFWGKQLWMLVNVELWRREINE